MLEDGSGTTDSLEKFLYEINKGPVDGSENWNELAEKNSNIAWPNEATDHVIRGNGGAGVVKEVAETPGTIGYANLAEARANAAFYPASEGGTGGPGTATFWAEVENGKNSYADPSTNGEVKTKADSNCSEEVYVNGSKTFPPPSTEEVWNEVAPRLTQTHYNLCDLTYDVALTHYKGFSVGTFAGSGVEAEEVAPTPAEAQTVSDYMKFELGKEAQAAANDDYLGDPTNSKKELNVLLIAQEGVKTIGF